MCGIMLALIENWPFALHFVVLSVNGVISVKYSMEKILIHSFFKVKCYFGLCIVC